MTKQGMTPCGLTSDFKKHIELQAVHAAPQLTTSVNELNKGRSFYFFLFFIFLVELFIKERLSTIIRDNF